VGDGARARARVMVHVVEDGRAAARRPDQLAVEEPLEIRLRDRSGTTTAAVTMRTPGSDFELAVGFLVGEGVVAEPGDVRRVSYCTDRTVDGEQRYNIVNVELTRPPRVEVERLERHFTMTSACGVCGKASIDALEQRGPAQAPARAGPPVDPAVLLGLPATMREAQRTFEATGGLHAAALFDRTGALLALREDVGRHNALDKVIGWALLEGRLPLHDSVALVSGRSSFELAQKAVVAGIPVLCSVSAPSSLAVEVAARFEMALVGFLRDGRFNVYTGVERIALLSAG
jgi:FdhD protein